MQSVDLAALAARVRAVLDDPAADVSSGGDGTLDRALADLSTQRRAGQPLSTALNYWHAPTPLADARGR